MLVGRDAECDRIAELLASAREQRSGALVLCGDPGIGKSALCAWAVSRADGMRVLSVHGVESEADLPFAGLSELCAGVLDRVGDLPEPQARALEAALARAGPPSPADRFAIGAAVLSLLAAAAGAGSVLVVIDDAQWLDASSADAILFAARRLRNEGVAMLIATRPAATFDVNGVLSRLTLAGLDSGAARTVLEAAHGSLPAHVADLLTQRVDGNPLALVEVPLGLSTAQLAGREPIDDPLPVGPSLGRALLHRLGGLPADVRRGLLIAAASGTERVQPVVDALAAARLPAGVLDAAERGGVVSVAGERFEFRHPLLRAAVYHDAPGPARRDAHAALARVATGESRAWHLAHATVGEDEAVAAMLEQVGLEARQRGAPAAAASALERAARLSAPGAARAERLTAAARDAYVAGRPAGALALLDDALADSPGPLPRAEIQHIRGRILVLQGHVEQAHRLLVGEAALIREAAPARAAAMLAEACLACLLRADVRLGIAAAREAASAAAGGDPGVQAYTRAVLACALTLGGERAEGRALLERSLPLLRHSDPLTEAGGPIAFAAQCCFWLERYDVASDLLAWLTAAARKAGAPAALLMPLSCRAELDVRNGRWAVAAAEADEAAALGEEMARSVFAAYALECLAGLAAAAGDEAACREHAARALRLIDQHGNELGRLYVHSALGLLELTLGRMDAAIGSLEAARALAEAHGLQEPNVVRWQPDLVEAYVRAGRADEAREVLRGLELQAKHTGGRWALGSAARCRGLLAEDADADACFTAALELLDPEVDPFDVARTHLSRGERLRRAGRRTDARRALRLAIGGFERVGAAPWAARAAGELGATGERARPRRADADRDVLTSHEMQVALVIAGGATNREAAAALFLSPKTIEFHLANIYRKLGVRTRSQLTALAATRGWLDAPRATRSGGTASA